MFPEKLNRAEAYRYMGYKGGGIPENIEALTDECEDSLLKSIVPKYVYRVFDIEETENGVEVSGAGLTFGGSDIKRHLSGCEKCVLLAATLGEGADKTIRGYEISGMEKAVIADCLASAAIEQVCDKAEEEIKSKLSGYFFTWRFSPGYGDFPLTVQRTFLDVLQAPKRIGLTVTDNFILLPRKSVTAVIGISKSGIPKGRRGCGCCNMKDRCEFRKRGEHCGF